MMCWGCVDYHLVAAWRSAKPSRRSSAGRCRGPASRPRVRGADNVTTEYGRKAISSAAGILSTHAAWKTECVQLHARPDHYQSFPCNSHHVHLESDLAKLLHGSRNDENTANGG